jgi:hypothetical protein
MWDLYKIYWRPFGDVLSAMESEGVRVNRWVRAQHSVAARAVLILVSFSTEQQLLQAWLMPMVISIWHLAMLLSALPAERLLDSIFYCGASD